MSENRAAPKTHWWTGLGLAGLEHEDDLGVGAGRRDQGEEGAVEDVGVGALIAVEGLGQQAQLPGLALVAKAPVR